jgi:hypothetical protein
VGGNRITYICEVVFNFKMRGDRPALPGFSAGASLYQSHIAYVTTGYNTSVETYVYPAQCPLICGTWGQPPSCPGCEGWADWVCGLGTPRCEGIGKFGCLLCAQQEKDYCMEACNSLCNPTNCRPRCNPLPHKCPVDCIPTKSCDSTGRCCYGCLCS